jgi:hypothetical protein
MVILAGLGDRRISLWRESIFGGIMRRADLRSKMSPKVGSSMKRIISVTLFGAALLFPAGGARAQDVKTYGGRLSPVPLTVAMQVDVAGSGSVTATLTSTKLSITGNFEGLRSPATVARIHKGTKPGIRGPALFDLKVSTGSSGTISGAFDLTAAQVQELAQGRYYVQLHSEKAPEGNLWGWLLLQESRR